MSLFLAACAALLVLVGTLARQIRTDARRDTLGLQAARADVVADLHHRAAQERNREVVRRNARALWKTARFQEAYSAGRVMVPAAAAAEQGQRVRLNGGWR